MFRKFFSDSVYLQHWLCKVTVVGVLAFYSASARACDTLYTDAVT